MVDVKNFRFILASGADRKLLALAASGAGLHRALALLAGEKKRGRSCSLSVFPMGSRRTMPPAIPAGWTRQSRSIEWTPPVPLVSPVSLAPPVPARPLAVPARPLAKKQELCVPLSCFHVWIQQGRGMLLCKTAGRFLAVCVGFARARAVGLRTGREVYKARHFWQRGCPDVRQAFGLSLAMLLPTWPIHGLHAFGWAKAPTPREHVVARGLNG